LYGTIAKLEIKPIELLTKTLFSERFYWSSGTQWRFLRLEESNATIDLIDYPLLPVDQILGFLVSMVQKG
jgi:hypothetical protein